MHHLQVDLLARHRAAAAADPHLERALLLQGHARPDLVELRVVGDNRSGPDHDGVELGAEAMAVVAGRIRGDPL